MNNKTDGQIAYEKFTTFYDYFSQGSHTELGWFDLKYSDQSHWEEIADAIKEHK